ncbi:DUF4439 domain-containing protein [Kineococcus sp. T90]|nr:DUF4439 domain-containing protein [Kineococcus indalonis]
MSVGSAGGAVPPRLRRLLAVLLTRAGSVVTVDRLADVVRDGAPAPEVPASLPRAPGGLLGREEDLAGLLTRLVQESVVAVDAPGGHRHRLLETLRAHGCERLAARGARPVGTRAAYDAAAGTAAEAVLLAASVEERLAAVYADLAAAAGTDRAVAAAGVVRAARAARGWGGTATSFPGLPELGEDGLPVPTATSTATRAPTSSATSAPTSSAAGTPGAGG